MRQPMGKRGYSSRAYDQPPSMAQACGEASTAAVYRLPASLQHAALVVAQEAGFEGQHALSFDAVDVLLALPEDEALMALAQVLESVRWCGQRSAPEVHNAVMRAAFGQPSYTPPEKRTVFVVNAPLSDPTDWTALDEPARLPRCMLPLLRELSLRCGPVVKYAVAKQGQKPRRWGTEPVCLHNAFFEFADVQAAERCLKVDQLGGQQVRVVPTNNGPIKRGFTVSDAVRRMFTTPTWAAQTHIAPQNQPARTLLIRRLARAPTPPTVDPCSTPGHSSSESSPRLPPLVDLSAEQNEPPPLLSPSDKDTSAELDTVWLAGVLQAVGRA